MDRRHANLAALAGILAWIFGLQAQADQNIFTPTIYQAGSSLTITPTVPLLGTWDFTDATVLGLGTGGGAVDSVFGRTGTVIALTGDYAAFYQPLDTELTGWAAKTPYAGTLTITTGQTLNVTTGGTLGTAAYTPSTTYEVPLTFSNSLRRSGNTIDLDADNDAPGNSFYYGTSAAGAKGFFALPAGGSGTVTSITATAPIVVTPTPLTTTGVISIGSFTNTGLLIQDTNASHTLNIKPGSDLTANRILTLTTGDAARNLTMTGDATISGTSSGTNTGDQTITLTGDVTGTGTGSFATTVAKIAALNTAGFVKTAGTTGVLSIDATSYQPLDADLTNLAAKTGTNTIYYRSGADTWSPVTIGAGIGFSGGDLTALASAPNDGAFAFDWNGMTGIAPSSNAVYDWGHKFDTDDDGLVNKLDMNDGIVQTTSGVVSAITGLDGQLLIGQSGSEQFIPKDVSGSGATMSLSNLGVLTISAITDAAITSSSNWNTAYTQRYAWDGFAPGGFPTFAADGRTSLGGTTLGQKFFTVTNPSAIRFFRSDASNALIVEDAATFRASIGAGTGSGTVTSSGSTGGLAKFTSGTNIGNATAGTDYLTTNQSISLTGDVTGTGATSIDTAIGAGKVTYAKMQDISATQRVLGRKTAGAGDPEELTLSEMLDFASGATQGDVLYRGATTWARLPVGTDGNQLTTHGAGQNPSWDAASSGGGGNVTTSGTISAGQLAEWVDATHIRSNTAAQSRTAIAATGLGDAFITMTAPLANSWMKLTNANTIIKEDAATTRTSLGASTTGSAIFTTTGPGTTAWMKASALGTVTYEDAATTRTSLGLGTAATANIGTGVQAWDTDLDTWAGKTPYAGNVAVTAGKTFTAANTVTLTGTDTLSYDLNNMTTGYTERRQWDGGATNLTAATGRTSLGIGDAAVYENASSAAQALATSEQSLTGSVITIPTAGGWVVGGQYRCSFDVTKTTGTAGITVQVKIGTTGGTGDTSVYSGTWPAGTSVGDTGRFDISLNWRVIGASAIVAVRQDINKNGTTAGLTNTGTQVTIGATTASGAFNSTAATKIGVTFTGGTSFSGTAGLVQAQYMQ